MMSLWDALRMNMMISYQELVRTFPNICNLKTSNCPVVLRRQAHPLSDRNTVLYHKILNGIFISSGIEDRCCVTSFTTCNCFC